MMARGLHAALARPHSVALLNCEVKHGVPKLMNALEPSVKSAVSSMAEKVAYRRWALKELLRWSIDCVLESTARAQRSYLQFPSPTR